jgi:hypothetical protein
MEVDHAAREMALVSEFQIQPDMVGQGALAAPDAGRHDKEVQRVDQPGLESLGGETGPSHRHRGTSGCLEPPHRVGVEVPLDPGPCARRALGVFEYTILSAACQTSVKSLETAR